jgi:ribosomal protein S21
MIKIVLRAGETIQSAVKRFSRLIKSCGLLRELKEREYYRKPSEKIRTRKNKDKNTARKAQTNVR